MRMLLPTIGTPERLAAHALSTATASVCRYERSPAQAAHGRMRTAARVLVPLSGGVDSTVVAALAHACLPPGVPIDLVSVCFDAGGSPDRVAALDAVQELQQVAPTREWRLITVDSTLDEVDEHHDQCASERSRALRCLCAMAFCCMHA